MIKLLSVWRYWLLLLCATLLLSACSDTQNSPDKPSNTSQNLTGDVSVIDQSADGEAQSGDFDGADVASAAAESSMTQSSAIEKNSSATAESANINTIDVEAPKADDQRLGTAWGDELDSKVEFVNLERVGDVLTSVNVFYSGQASGKKVNSISLLAGQVHFSIIDDAGRPLPTFRNNNDYSVQGKVGQRYRLKYSNQGNTTYSVVASVDGLDVITGSTASQYDDGYILYPNETLIIDGFRKDENTVAAFTFSKPEASYTNHNDQGDINNTGVIGTAFFELRNPNQGKMKFASPPNAQPNKPRAFPADN